MEKNGKNVKKIGYEEGAVLNSCFLLELESFFCKS
jgi:hypothetical protein